MPRPRAAASRAGPQMYGFQLTCALPGHGRSFHGVDQAPCRLGGHANPYEQAA